jgi:hypothetical protein
VLTVDSEKLPKADDLKSHLFASTLVASATDREIRITARGAFPNLSLLVDFVPVAAVTPAMQSLLERIKSAETAGTSATPTAGGATAAAGEQSRGGVKPGGGGSGPLGAPPPGQAGPARPGGPRGGRP